LAQNQPLPVQSTTRPGWEKPLLVRAVPAPKDRLAFLSHPRLRRAGAMTQHSVAAALEALGEDAARIQAGQAILGIIVCMMAGSVTYSRRFYEEVLHDPATASPLIFPETVFNAPASHLAAFLGAKTINYTLVGDDGTFLQALALGAGWLEENRVDGCIVIGAEEVDWIVADALRLFHRGSIYAGGAGAIYIKKTPRPVELALVTDSYLYTPERKRQAAATQMRAQFGLGDADELLCDSQPPEHTVWKDWTGRRLSPKFILGEAFVASAAWQCVAANDAMQANGLKAVNISTVGANQQAIGARFCRP
jgi:3-oxoacyl-(acyl-carrier-protein) synthase